ncbi:uncharacterized protein LOC143887075 [Tasmannia lanceolata]|uniref:uncharacterized protein LOC143887075 n=1 Tax=Tasmannia lanceolata TaxID=3420 RepID=UPI004064BE12
MENRSREARRRRIVERGSDRLAFITGQIPSLPSSSSPPLQISQTSAPHNLNGASHDEDDAIGSVLPASETVSNPSDANNKLHPLNPPTSEALRNPLDTISELQPRISPSSEAVRNPSDSHSEIQPSISSAAQNTSISTSDINPRVVEPHHSRIFTGTRIISSISASENIRLICSAIIALLVVISTHSNPLGSNIIRNVVAYRPLYLVLLTDVTIVLGILLGSRGAYDMGKGARKTGNDEYGWADSLVKALEVGLVLQKAMNAAFMDCSVYAVLLICALFLRQYWF